MCGIFSIFDYRNGNTGIRETEIERVCDSMRSRGPDGKGVWIDRVAGIGMGHRRLSIIDLSECGVQPMGTSDGMYRIVFNGEIYNYKELRCELERKGYRFFSNSDTEVLLHLYADRGFEMVRSLRGMFAFALWDAKKKGLFVVRDPFGIKPLYYADDGRTIRVVSQVKSLLESDRVDNRPEPAGHVGFFLWGHIPEPYTLYKGIRAIPAGTYLWVDSGGVRGPTCYYSVSNIIAEAGGAAKDLEAEDFRETLREVLSDTINHHLVSDVPVGVFLSSGIDSATITALASQVIRENLKTLTVGFHEFEGTEKDETPLASRIAGHYGTSHRTYWISEEDFSCDKEKILNAMDQPSIDGVNTYFISKAAAACGMKVVLSGVGGDELFGGYSTFRELPAMVRTLSKVSWIPGVGKTARRAIYPIIRKWTSPKYAGLLEYGGTYGGAYLIRKALFMPWELSGLRLLDDDLITQGVSDLNTLENLENTVKGIPFDRSKVTALEVSWYMRNQLLRDTDWAGMTHSIEIRIPFVDVELFRHLSRCLAANHPPNKADLGSTPNVPLPNEVLNRPKTGFHTPVDRWIQRDGIDKRRERGLRGWAKLVYRHFN